MHEDDDFHEDLKGGEVAELMITVNEEAQWSLANYVTWTRKNNLKRKACENESITVDNFKPTVAKSVGELEALV